jgi:hypothetical protein
MIGSRLLLPVICFSLFSVLWLIGCEEDKEEVVDNPPPPIPPIQIPYAEDSVVRYPESVYALVYQMNISPGEGSIEVTLSGETGAVEAEVVIQAVVLLYEVVLLPIAQVRTIKGHPAMTPYKKSVRIDGLKKGEYRIYLIGTDPENWERRFMMTETVEVK